MRNLVEYPVSREEIVQCLKNYQHAAEFEDRIGDMRPTLLKLAVEIVAQERDNRKVYQLEHLP